MPLSLMSFSFFIALEVLLSSMLLSAITVSRIDGFMPNSPKVLLDENNTEIVMTDINSCFIKFSSTNNIQKHYLNAT
jgi:hypothetical protein